MKAAGWARIGWQALPLALAGVLCGCPSVPRYEQPRVEPPERYRYTEADTPAPFPTDGWWTMFNDPALNGFVERVLGANQDLAIALGRVDEARGILGVARADRYPTLVLDPSASRSRTSATDGNPLPHLETTLLALPATVSYEVDLRGRVRHTVGAARAQLQASEHALASLRISLAAEATINVLQIRSLDREIDVLERTVALRLQSLDLVESRFRAGVVGSLDVARARTDLEITRADLEAARQSRERVMHALAVLADRLAPDFELGPGPLEPAVPEISAGLPSQLLERRPDVAQSERELAASHEEIGVAHAAFFPRLVLTGLGGVASTDLSTLFDGASTLWSIGADASYPAFDGGRNRGNFEAAKARYRESLAFYRKTVTVAFREVQDALSDATLLRRRALALDAALLAARDASIVSRSRYERGLVSYLEVVESERTELDTERAVIQTRQEQLVAAVSLIKALGGGWSPP